jgi:hypothetical protein
MAAQSLLLQQNAMPCSGDVMTERMYLFLVGAFILFALYLQNNYLIYGLAVLLTLEGVSGVRLTRLLQKARRVSPGTGLVEFNTHARFDVDGLSAWRVMVAVVLVTSYGLMHEYGYDVLWFIPWFMGFAILGAVASGICPFLLALRWVGFK